MLWGDSFVHFRLSVCFVLKPENAFVPAAPAVIAGGPINFLQSTSCVLHGPKFGAVWPFLQVYMREMGLKPSALIRIYGTLKSQWCRCLKQSQKNWEKKKSRLETQVIICIKKKKLSLVHCLIFTTHSVPCTRMWMCLVSSCWVWSKTILVCKRQIKVWKHLFFMYTLATVWKVPLFLDYTGEMVPAAHPCPVFSKTVSQFKVMRFVRPRLSPASSLTSCRRFSRLCNQVNTGQPPSFEVTFNCKLGCEELLMEDYGVTWILGAFA